MTDPVLSRRQFCVASAAGFAALALPGCGEPDAASAAGATLASRTVSHSFDIGVPRKYRVNRVYTEFAKSHGVYLVSGHGMLVALAAECTSTKHDTTLVRWEPEVGVFRCPKCGARYTRDGLNIGDRQTRRPLERCRIRQSGKIFDRDTTLVVDPGKRFRQERQQWSKHTSFFPLVEVVTTQQQRERLDRQRRARDAERPPLAR
ncbi:MAG: hypothetical protein AAF710_03450 [Planctomycetota bacterium]